MLFDGLIGQHDVRERLNASIEHLAHAYVFNGPEGIGKMTFATELAKFLLCTEPLDQQACGVCKSCQLVLAGTSPDIMIVSQDKKTSISIDAIRELQKHIILRPVYTKRKVYVICKADNMTEEAQNCLLKTLEEPPDYAMLILTANNFSSLKDTIRSRSMRVDFSRYEKSELIQILQLNGFDDKTMSDFWVNSADGIPGRALELAINEGLDTIRAKIFDLLLVCKMKSSGYVGLYQFLEEEKVQISLLLNLLESFLRDLMVISTGADPKLLLNVDKKDIIIRDAPQWSLSSIVNSISHVEECRRALASNANYSNAMQVLALNIQEECNL